MNKKSIVAQNVQLELREGGMKASLSCEHGGARYHVWLDHEFALSGDILYKNPPLGAKVWGPGYYNTRKLNTASAFGSVLVADMQRQMDERGLREKAAGDLQARKAAEAKAHAESVLAQRKEDASDELFDVLNEAIEATQQWGGDLSDEPAWMKKAREIVARVTAA